MDARVNLKKRGICTITTEIIGLFLTTFNEIVQKRMKYVENSRQK